LISHETVFDTAADAAVDARPSAPLRRALAISMLASAALTPLLVYGLTPQLDWVPWSSATADILFHATVIKSVIGGTFLPFFAYSNPDLGFPSGLQAADFPLTEPFQFLLLKPLALFSTNPFVVMNLYYMLTFVLTAAAFSALCVSLGTRVSTAVTFALIYTFIPLHLERMNHLFLCCALFLVPGATLICVWLWQPRPLLGRAAGSRLWFALLIAAIIGCSGVYYAVFSALLIAVAALAAALTRRSARHLVSGAVLALVIAATFLITLAPTLAYQAQHGPNPAAVRRAAYEAEFYGLRLGMFALPPPDHRIHALGALGKAFEAGRTYRIEGQKVEYVGATALIGLVLAFCTAWRKRPSELGLEWLIVLLASAAFLYATPGGGASIFASLVTPEVRSVNRISMFIACLGVLGAALSGDRVLARTTYGGRMAALFVIGMLALFDQVPATSHKRAAARPYVADTRAFFARAQATLPSGAAVLQLPYVSFPESGWTGRMHDYQHFEAYLFTDGLRFSYGAIKGRSAAAAIARLSRLPLDLKRLRDQGFSAILIDRRGYRDQGLELEVFLKSSGVPKLIESARRERALYKL
jgi:phosphoglycerol transferase